MNATVGGTPGGIQSGDVITKIEIVWKSGAETEAQAQSAGRAVTLTAAGDITAFQAGTYTLSSSYLVSGQTYTPAVRVTESRGGVDGFVGSWASYSAFTATTPDTDFAAYTIQGNITVDSSVYASGTGSTSVKFVDTDGGIPTVQMYRNVTMPASGTYAFTRWFRISAKSTVSSSCAHFVGFANSGPSLSMWYLETGYNHDASYPTRSGLGIVDKNGGSPLFIAVYGESSMQLNTWYKTVTEINCTSNLYRLTVYAADGTSLLAQSSWYSAPTNFAGVTGAIVLGRAGFAGAYWLDGLTDGV